MTDNNGLNPKNEISEEELKSITGGCVMVDGEEYDDEEYSKRQTDGGSDEDSKVGGDIYDGMPRTSPGTLVRVTR